MDLAELRQHWETLGAEDPLWAILSHPSKAGRRWDTAEFFAYGEQEIRELLPYLDSLPIRGRRRRALDFGCGVGRLTQPLAQAFRRVDGVDIATSMLNLARAHNKAGRRCRFHHNSRPDLALFRADRFDLIYSNIVFQHMPPDAMKGYLGEFVRVLAPGGVAVFQIPHGMDPAVVHVDSLERLAAEDPTLTKLIDMYCLPREEVLAVIQGRGARLVDIQESPWAQPLTSYRYAVTKDRPSGWRRRLRWN